MSTETTNKKIRIDNGTTFGRTYTDKAVDELLKNAGGGVGVIELSDSQVQSINSHDTITFTTEQANIIKKDNISSIVVKYQGSSFYKLSVSKVTIENDSIYTLGGFAKFALGSPCAITLSVADFTQPAKILYRDLPEYYLSTVEIGGDDSLVFSQNDDVNYTRKIYVDKINGDPIMHDIFDESKNYSFTEDKSITIFGKHSVLVPKDSADTNILPCTPSDNGKVLSVVNGEAQWASATGGGGVGIIDISSTWSAITPTDFTSLKFKSYLVGNMIYIEIKAIFKNRPATSMALFQNTTYIISEDVTLPFFDGLDAKRIVGNDNKKLYVTNPVDSYRFYLSGWFTIEA